MSYKNISFYYKKKRFRIRANSCSNFQIIRGLMFRRKEKSEVLLFEFSNKTKMKIHSFFVFFPFVAIWLDEENKIVDIKRVEPFEFSVGIGKFYKKLIEIPINKKYAKEIKLLVGD